MSNKSFTNDFYKGMKDQFCINLSVKGFEKFVKTYLRTK